MLSNHNPCAPQAWTVERTTYLGTVLQNMLRRYTDAAVSFTTALLTFISRFALQVTVCSNYESKTAALLCNARDSKAETFILAQHFISQFWRHWLSIYLYLSISHIYIYLLVHLDEVLQQDSKEKDYRAIILMAVIKKLDCLYTCRAPSLREVKSRSSCS